MWPAIDLNALVRQSMTFQGQELADDALQCQPMVTAHVEDIRLPINECDVVLTQKSDCGENIL